MGEASTTIRAANRRGFNLVEAAIVLGVVGLVIGGIWVAASNVRQNLIASRTVSGVVSACHAASRTFPSRLAPASGGEAVRITEAIAAKVFPDDWVTGNALQSPVGGPIVFTWHALDDPTVSVPVHGAISIYLIDVPLKYCLRLLPLINGRNPGPLAWVSVGTGGNDTSWTTVTDYVMPYSGNMSAGCGTAALTKIEFGCKQR